jgi:IS5 family transposase
METYLRLMFLKFRYRLGYESLCREVADSISWRRFCRIRLDGQVPHPTTLMNLTTRCGATAVDACNGALLAKAAEAKLLRISRLRADTTVVPAKVAYPIDSGLLAKSARRIAATGRRIRAAGGAIRTRLRDRSRAAGNRAHAIAAKLRLRSAAGREETQATVRRITGELAGLAERAPPTPSGCWPTPGGRCAAPGPRPPALPWATETPRRAGGGAGCSGPSMTSPSC